LIAGNSLGASIHAAQNERLPAVRAVIQVFFSEQTKLNRHIDWSASFSSLRSPSVYDGVFDRPARCLSKREMNTQQMEIKKTEGRCLQAAKSVQCHAKHRWKRWLRRRKVSLNGRNLLLV